ncbi:MAG: GNAT family N-acetyltransferase [Anaerolineaceae bacterium]|nr:GNAT family N-acetyltransferase [Anaerolineaceae bacterium]
MVDAAVPDVLITTYLEMTSVGQFNSDYSNHPDIEIVELGRPDVAFYRFLYSEVGYIWHWRDRLIMSEDELRQTISKPEVSIHVPYVQGVPAGYVELDRQGDSTEVAYFGLRQGFMGIGLGKHLLSYGIHRAWVDGAKRLWVHTCNLDGPYALDNYIKRGFRVYKTEEEPMPQRYAE